LNETYAEFIPKFLKKRQLQEESDNASTRDIYLDSKDDEDEDEDNFLPRVEALPALDDTDADAGALDADGFGVLDFSSDEDITY